MNSHFTADFFRNNRANLLSLCGGMAPVILAAHGLMQRNSDTTFPFRQDSSFWYLTGINEPDIVLVIDQDQEYLIVPQREATREAFDGSIDADHLRAISGVEEVVSEKAGWKRLETRLKDERQAATLMPPSAFVEALGIYTNPARQHLVNQMKTYNSSLELIDLRSYLAKLRAIKQDPELAAIQTAISVTIDTLNEVRQGSFADFSAEYEVEAAITAGFRKRTAGHGYTPIVAGGRNACTLHYVQNNARLSRGELLLLDVGAEVENYSADITRTYANGTSTKRQQEVQAAVIEVQDYAMGLLKPGVKVKEYETQIEQFMGDRLRSLGLIRSISHESVREYYPHATSHFLGLDVHDVGDYESPLKPGMVLTVEPGIYIPAESIGVRIEDNVVVTEDGIRILTEGLPRSELSQ